MQMQNGKISLRQYKRLLFFDMVGLGLVILPDLLARHAERAGGCSIFLGALLASLYGGLLLACMRGGVRDRSWLYLPYGIYLLFVGAFGIYLLADLVHTFLLSEESFLLLTVLILLLVLYSRRAGLEGRGRTFEVLFWPMLLLLIILLALGASSLRGMNLFPLQLSKKGFAFLGWYPAFLVFSSCQFVFFMGDGLEDGVDQKAQWKGTCEMIWLSALAMLLISLGQYYYSRKSGGLVVLLAWLSALALCFPFFLMERKKRKRGMALAVLCLGMVLFGCGCSVQELENKSFPMVMTLRAEDGDCVLTYKYMDLSRVSEKEKTKQGSDELTVRSSSVRGVIRRMDEKNGKILDLNHVKVLLLEAEFLEEKDFMQELVEIGNSGVDLPGNMIVFVAEDVDAISNLQEEMDEDLGNYLAEMLEGNPNYEDTSGATFKSLICDWYNGGSSTILPSLGVQDDLPVVEGYYLMQTDVSGDDQILRKVTAEEGYVAGLCSGAIGMVDMDVDGGQIHLENVKVSYEYTATNSGVGCQLTFRGDIIQKDSIDLSAQKLQEAAAAYLAGMIQNAYEQKGLDLANSYGHLRCHDLDLYEKYQGRAGAYRKDLHLETICKFRVVE